MPTENNPGKMSPCKEKQVNFSIIDTEYNKSDGIKAYSENNLFFWGGGVDIFLKLKQIIKPQFYIYALFLVTA